MYTMKTKHVYLGRFAPFHNGHKKLMSELVLRYGQESVLVLIGSTNTLNKRTPYTYEDRKEIIEVSYPDIEVLPLPDGKPNLEYFDGTTNDAWLDNIERIAAERGEKFVFYGGSELDLEVLSQRFETKVIVNREILKISATQVREAIENQDMDRIKELVDPKSVELVISKYKSL